MGTYYKIETENNIIKDNLYSISEVLLTIRKNKLNEYRVLKKNDSVVSAQNPILPLPPMCQDITKEIREQLKQYELIEKEEGNCDV